MKQQTIMIIMFDNQHHRKKMELQCGYIFFLQEKEELTNLQYSS